MNLLFLHQNFPGQFVHLAPALAARGHEVRATTLQPVKDPQWQGVTLIPYALARGTTPNIHPWAAETETKVIRGEACFRACAALKQQGYSPEVIVAHPGWGESLFIKDLWPQARLAIYCEFFYHPSGADFGFDPEFPPQDSADCCRLRMKNVNNLMHFEIADAGLAPTHWQASTFPERFRDQITVIHDGIDTDALQPNPEVSLTLNQSLTLTRRDPVITFVNRNLEPYRGYHIFMRALPEILARNPQARVLIIGGNAVSYGAAAPPGTTWRELFLNEVKDRLDLSRVHFLGNLPYAAYLAVMQISAVHVYLTYPFVLSWSLLEAMSMGCCIVASDTAPVREAIRDGETGRLVDFFDTEALAKAVCELLDDAPARARLGQNARVFAQATYDLKRICRPQQLEWVETLAADRPLPPAPRAPVAPASQLPEPPPMTQTFLHIGCGPKRKDQTTAGFNRPEWTEIRLDIDPAVQPDVVGTMTDMAAVETGSMDALFSSHNIEHLYAHEVPVALAEFHRVLKPEGFAVITCPDLQSVCALVAEDKLLEPAYTSPAGPIAPLDILYGHRPALARGNLYMAHKCGFTERVLIGVLQQAGFAGIASRRRGAPFFDLWAVATKRPLPDDVLRALTAGHVPGG